MKILGIIRRSENLANEYIKEIAKRSELEDAYHIAIASE